MYNVASEELTSNHSSPMKLESSNCRKHSSFIAQMVQQYNNFTHNVKSHASGESRHSAREKKIPLLQRARCDPMQCAEDSSLQDESGAADFSEADRDAVEAKEDFGSAFSDFLSPPCRAQSTMVCTGKS